MVAGLVGGRARGRRLLAVCALLALLAGAQAPARIVSTFPSATETLFALGAGSRVVGVSNYCQFPPAARALPKVGTYLDPDPERIARLRPDLVIVTDPATVLTGRLSALGIRSEAVKVVSIEDIFSMIGGIGAAVGLPGPATQLNARLRARLEAVRAATRDQPRPSVLLVVGRDPGRLTNLTGAGASSYLGQLLEIAGGRNVLAGTAIAYPRISLETVVRLDPDVILDASMTATDDAAAAARLRQPWLEQRELSAERSGRVFGLTSEALVTPGPRVADAVDLLRASLIDGRGPQSGLRPDAPLMLAGGQRP